MSAPSSQAFRTQSSSKIISIPTRHDPKSNQRVVLLKDIQLSFEHLVKRIMCGCEVVLFLADEDFEYLIPPRIAHQPGVILDVITTDDNQDDSSPMGVSSTSTHAVGELSALTSSRNEGISLARDVATLRIRGADGNNQFLIVGPRELSSENMLQQAPTSVSDPLQLETRNNIEKPHPMQQMEEIVERIQQTDQKMEEAITRIQQTDQRMEDVLAGVQQTDQQRTRTTTNARPGWPYSTEFATDQSTPYRGG
ncbi:MAG: hypothetical protein J3Q66DRAFT_337638 [Benniella sp.]|nr:MAG: hypothetical protein J3Q66DRAFT_337638 [Benniella sp.]